MSETVRLAYKPKGGIMILAIAFFGACALVIAGASVNGSGGLRLFGPLDAGSARAASWALVAACLGFIGFGAAVLARGILSPGEVELGAQALTAPPGPVSKKRVTVLYRDIREMTIRDQRGRQILRIEHAGGRLSLVQEALPKGITVRQIADEISRRRDREDEQ